MRKEIITFVAVLAGLVFFQLRADAALVEENGFVYQDAEKTIVVEIPDEEKLVIPEGVKELSDAVYYVRKRVYREKTIFTNVKEIYLPASLTEYAEYYMDEEVFPNLENIEVARDNPKYRFTDGLLYIIAEGKEKTVRWAHSQIAKGKIVFPSTVESIYPRVFEGCSKITELTLSKEFQKIQSEYTLAFNKENMGNCENLKAIYLEDGNKNFRSVKGCLYNAEGTKLILVPWGYEGELVIPEGTMRTARGAFRKCSKLTVVKIPYGMTEVGEFIDCNSLKKVVISATVEKNVYFCRCDKLETIKFMSKKPPKKINTWLVYECSNLKKVVVPKGTKKVYKEAIKGEACKLIKEGKYQPEKKEIKSIQKPNLTITTKVYSWGTRFNFKWPQVLYAEKYEIQFEENGRWKTANLSEKYQRKLNKPYPGKSINFEAKTLGLIDGGVYKVRVVACCGDVKSVSNSQGICFVKQPKVVSVTTKKDGKVVLRWTKQNVSGYRIRVCGFDGTEREYVIRRGDKTKKTITGLKENVKYKIYVSAYVKKENKEWISLKSKVQVIRWNQ